MKKNLNLLSGVAMAACMLFSTGAMAQTMSATDQNAAEARIKADYKVDKKACDASSGNAQDICVANAKGKEAVALAELDNSYKPTQKTQNKVDVAKAEATYDVAMQKCDDLSGNPKDVCVKEAKAALTTAKADAKVKMKTAATNTKAANETKEVRVDAAADKRAAQLKVAEEKCDALSSTAKDTCLTKANNSFGKL